MRLFPGMKLVRKYALISKYALKSEMRLITRAYGTILTGACKPTELCIDQSHGVRGIFGGGRGGVSGCSVTPVSPRQQLEAEAINWGKLHIRSSKPSAVSQSSNLTLVLKHMIHPRR